MTRLYLRIQCLLLGHVITHRFLTDPRMGGRPVTVRHCERCRKAKLVVFER